MRIIAGKFKGRVIEMQREVRPTSDKVREALFEILKNRIVGARFLDLYCGSGAVGIEAFSRGAKSIALVDNNLRCIATLKENLNRLDIEDLSSIHIYKKEALKALKEFNRLSMTFDVIFLDPPYYKDMARNTLIALSNYDILPANTVVVAEAYKKEILPEKIGLLKKARTSRYGDTKLEFFERSELI